MSDFSTAIARDPVKQFSVFAENRVVHVSLRAKDAANLAKYQDYVVSLPFPDYED